MKKCLYCAEEIQDEAIKCKHCGEFLNAAVPPALPAIKGSWYFETAYRDRPFVRGTVRIADDLVASEAEGGLESCDHPGNTGADLDGISSHDRGVETVGGANEIAPQERVDLKN
ncbi:MAG: hypothetical protein V4689_17970 [Verrucomicrobiota bacterium]